MQRLSQKQILLLAITTIFLIVEIILGTLVHTSHSHVPEISFSVTVLVFLFSLVLFTKTTQWTLTAVALICTVFADLFLLIIEPQQKLIAMCFFSVTQICYFIRLYLNHTTKEEKIAHISVRCTVILAIILITNIVLGDKTDALSIVSMVYYTNLIINIAFAFVQIKKSVIFPIGLLLFALCDAFVGLEVLEELYMDVSQTSVIYLLKSLNINIAWVFYVPSQLLIVLSLFKSKMLSLGKE